MAYEDIIYSVENEGIAVITLNRPDAMNALSHRTHAEFAQTIDEANRDDAVRMLVITGASRGFCSGDDAKSIFPGGGATHAPAFMEKREPKFQGR